MRLQEYIPDVLWGRLATCGRLASPCTGFSRALRVVAPAIPAMVEVGNLHELLPPDDRKTR